MKKCRLFGIGPRPRGFANAADNLLSLATMFTLSPALTFVVPSFQYFL